MMKTFGEHLIWLEKVSIKIRRANLVINREKSHFCISRVQYLGFIIDSEGIHIDPDGTSPLREFPIS